MSAFTLSNRKVDHRPPRGGWADGNYMCTCFACQAGFIGDKRATQCADCAYKESQDLTVGQLKKQLERVPDDAQICMAVLGHYAAPRRVTWCVKDNAVIIWSE